MIIYKMISVIWSNKVIYPYIIYIFSIIKYIVSHPLFKVIKMIFNILIVFEGIIIIVYYTDFSVFYDLSNLHSNIFTNISELIYNIYTEVLKYLRDKINYLLDEQIIESTDNIINNEIKKTNYYDSKEGISDYNWWIPITIVVIISGIVIYYYYPNIYPEILDFFNKFKDREEHNLLDSPNSIQSSIPNSPQESDYFKDLNELTPKPTSSNLPSTT